MWYVSETKPPPWEAMKKWAEGQCLGFFKKGSGDVVMGKFLQDKRNFYLHCTVYYMIYIIYIIYIYMGSGRFPGPMELLLQQLVRVSKTR